MVVDLMAKSNAADLKRAAEIMADEEDPDLPPLESKAINPYKRAKPIAPVFAMAQAARKVSPTEAAQVAMKKNPVPMMAAALPAPRVLSLEKSFLSKNPFSGKNYLQISAVDVIYDLVRYRMSVTELDRNDPKKRSRRARTKLVCDNLIRLMPEEDCVYFDPAKAPKEGLGTFEERDAFLMKTHSVVERAVIALNQERVPLMNRLMRTEWLKKRQQGEKVPHMFKARKEKATTVLQLATLVEKTKTYFDAGQSK